MAWMPARYVGLLVRWLERLALGTPYGKVVDRVERIVADEAIAGKCQLTVDATGVGAPVVEMIRRRRLECGVTAVTITGGAKVGGSGQDVTVPKADLLGGLLVLLEKGELQIARSLAETPRLVTELASMRRSGGTEHDDLAMAVGLACWSAGRVRSIQGRNRLL
ncbi:MAG: hypothetical protein HY820_32235 [Acidobacteria bacterium]|nr:hypothetical protein [Acidobacteriota bacterium]